MGASDHSTLKPPKLRPFEIAKVVRATGKERGRLLDEPFDALPLVGQEVVVQGAAPTANRRGWEIYAWVDSIEDEVTFPERALESTGRIVRAQDDGTTPEVLLRETNEPPWQDDLLLDVVTDTPSRDVAEAIAERAAGALRGLEGVDDVAWRLTEWKEDTAVCITLWLWSKGDVLRVFPRILRQVEQVWEHEKDESQFITSTWRRSTGVDFLGQGIQEVTVSYRRWTSPRRRSRRELDLPT